MFHRNWKRQIQCIQIPKDHYNVSHFTIAYPPGTGCNSFFYWFFIDDPFPPNLHPLCCWFFIYIVCSKVLSKYYPEVATSTPSIGRKGKALRRRHQRRSAESQLHLKGSAASACHMRQNFPAVVPAESKTGIGNPFSWLPSFQHLKKVKQWKHLRRR